MAGTNRVAVYYNNRDVRIEERTVPTIGPRELLVKVHASGICGSDVLEWYRVPKAPVVLGHEIGAEIVRVGGEVRRWKVGDRVFVSHHVPCGECAHCKAGHETVCETLRKTNFDPGGFAEYVRVPEVNVKQGVFQVPDSLTYEEATFIEPLACVVRGQRAAKVWSTDIAQHRLEAAKRSGADAAWDAREDIAAKITAASGGRRADIVFTCTGAPAAIDQAFKCVTAGGTILFFAPTNPEDAAAIPFNDLWRNEVTMTSTYGAAPRDIRESIELLGKGTVKVRDLVTHRLPLTDAGAGFRLVAEGKDSLKVILEPTR